MVSFVFACILTIDIVLALFVFGGFASPDFFGYIAVLIASTEIILSIISLVFIKKYNLNGKNIRFFVILFAYVLSGVKY